MRGGNAHNAIPLQKKRRLYRPRQANGMAQQVEQSDERPRISVLQRSGFMQSSALFENATDEDIPRQIQHDSASVFNRPQTEVRSESSDNHGYENHRHSRVCRIYESFEF